MDYKYIEQLVERYFQCQTTLQEEQILRSFFAQSPEEVPGQLRRYAPLFAALTPGEPALGDDFDERILALTEEAAPVVKARTVSIAERLRPLLRAAAVVAVVLALGQAMDLSMRSAQPQNDDINYAAYHDTYEDPAVAFDQVEDALELLSDGYSRARTADSIISVMAVQGDSTQVE